MKNFIAALFAVAIVFRVNDIQQEQPPNITWRLQLVYIGVDVPGGALHMDDFPVQVAPTLTPAQILTTIVGAVQSQATANGFTVPAGSTLTPSFTKS